MQGAERLAAHDRPLRGLGFGAGALEAGGDERVERRVDRLGAADAGLQQLDRRDLLDADQAPQLDGAQVAKLAHLESVPS